jgi:hypothetical protein
MRLSMLAATAAATALCAAAANAGEVLVTGSGTWGPLAPTTLVSAPEESFSFSFDLPNPIASNPTIQATDFSYDLAGAPVAVGLDGVVFFPTSSSGLFDLDLASGDVVSLYGADVGSSLTLTTGVFPATVGYAGSPPVGEGTVTITAVPEPSAWVMMLLGVGALGAVARMRRTAGAATA